MRKDQKVKAPRVDVVDDPAWVYRASQRKILAAWTDIIDELISKAKEGSYQHAKFLAEHARLAEAASDEGPPLDTEEVARLVLEDLLGDGRRERAGARRFSGPNDRPSEVD